MQQELYYKEALKLGQKEVRAKIAKNEDPYLPALDELIPPEKALTGIRLGVLQIPVWFIVGTKTAGRLNAFSASFLTSGMALRRATPPPATITLSTPFPSVFARTCSSIVPSL